MIASSASRNASRFTLSLYGNETGGATRCPSRVPRSRTPQSMASEHALEVVARYGDSVVGVTHLAAPVGRQRARAVAAIALGVACLVATVARFAGAMQRDTNDSLANAAWIAAGKPAYAFRARVADPVD